MLLYDLISEARVQPGERKSIDLKLINFLETNKTISSYNTTLKELDTLILPEELKHYVDKLKKDIEKEIVTTNQLLNQPNVRFDLFMNGIIKNCRESVASFRNTNKFIYRGIKNKSDAVYGRSHDERRTRDSDQFYSDIFNQMLKEAGVKARRDNSIFCTSDKQQALNYGTSYIIFLRDGFDCSFSQNTKDLTLDDTTAYKMFDKSILKQLFDEIVNNSQMKEIFMKEMAQWVNNVDVKDESKIGETGFFGEYRWRDHQRDITNLARRGLIDQSYAERVKIENLITPKSIVNNYGIVQNNLIAAIQSNKEIMISGYFYGIRSVFEDDVRKKLGMGK